MAYDIGPKIGIEGEAAFRKSIQDINTGMKTLSTEMQVVASRFDKSDDSQEAYVERSKVLNKQIDLQKQKLEQLRKGLEASADKYGENDKVTQGWQQAVNKATAELNNMERDLKDNEKALDSLGNEMEDATEKSGRFGNAVSKLAPGLVKIGGTAAKAAVAGITSVAVAAGAAAIKIGQSVVKQFGELEQNLGGSEAVFGKYAASIQKAGEDAYKNLGVSQSEYLATANKMGALFQGTGLEQQRSLELTEKAMQRAADMASVMGIDMQQALDSVAGAAKGNFTMMDNLGVAMNATNIEAYALAKGLNFTWKTATQAEKAEVAMQMFFEKTEQYAGNFAKESTQTITGSIGLLKAALSSFTAGLGNANADMTNLTGNLVDAFQAVVKNITPVIENIVKALPTAISGLLGAITQLSPTLIEAATGLFGQMLETIIGMLPEITPVVVSAITMIAKTITDNAPMLIDAGVEAIVTLIDGFVEALPQIIEAAVQIIMTLVQSLSKNISKLIDAAVKIVFALVDGILDLLPELIPAAIALILALTNGIIDALPKLIEKIPLIVESIVTTITENIPLILEAALQIVIALAGAIIKNLPLLAKTTLEFNIALFKGLIATIGKVIEFVPKLFSELVEAFKKIDWGELGKNIIGGIIQGVKNAAKNLATSVVDSAKGALTKTKDFLGIKSPSRVMRDQVGKMIGAGMAEGIKASAGKVDAAMQGINSSITTKVDTPKFSGVSSNVYVSVPVNLDGKIITAATSRTQYKKNQTSRRVLGVVPG